MLLVVLAVMVLVAAREAAHAVPPGWSGLGTGTLSLSLASDRSHGSDDDSDSDSDDSDSDSDSDTDDDSDDDSDSDSDSGDDSDDDDDSGSDSDDSGGDSGKGSDKSSDKSSDKGSDKGPGKGSDKGPGSNTGGGSGSGSGDDSASIGGGSAPVGSTGSGASATPGNTWSEGSAGAPPSRGATDGAVPGPPASVGGGIAGTGSTPLALVYDNPPFADDDNAQELAAMLTKSHFKFRITYVGGKHTPLTADLLGRAALFAFPGGDVETETAKRDFAREIPLVQQFVSGGGHYLGVCAGGFVAGKEGFGVFPGEVGSYVESPGAQFKDDKDHAVTVKWRGSTTRAVDFQDGNYFKIPPGTPGVTVLGTYTNGLPAAAVAVHGRGKAAFTGPHFESTTDDDNPKSAALDLDFQLLDVLMSPSNATQ
jgi:glutamine amidotransferase-like uncharacterized protein